jgi:hypothetical protein
VPPSKLDTQGLVLKVMWVAGYSPADEEQQRKGHTKKMSYKLHENEIMLAAEVCASSTLWVRTFRVSLPCGALNGI